MGIRQKFFVLSGVVGLLLAVVSIVGYYTASTNLNASIEGEINYTVRAEAEELEGWLREKKASATYAASLMTGFNGNMAKIKSIDSLSSVADDQEILDLNIGMEDGYFASLKTGDGTGRLDPRTRPWYTDTKKTGKAIFGSSPLGSPPAMRRTFRLELKTHGFGTISTPATSAAIEVALESSTYRTPSISATVCMRCGSGSKERNARRIVLSSTPAASRSCIAASALRERTGLSK